MIMTKKYYEANCILAMEFLDDNYRKYWETGTLAELEEIKKEYYDLGFTLSDFDFCTKQPDAKIRHFLNVVEYNWFHNKEMLDRLHITSLDALIERALDNWDYK